MPPLVARCVGLLLGVLIAPSAAAAQLRSTANAPVSLQPAPVQTSAADFSPPLQTLPQLGATETPQTVPQATLPTQPPWTTGDDLRAAPLATLSSAEPTAAATQPMPINATGRTPITRESMPAAGTRPTASLGGTIWGAVACLAFVGLLAVGATRTLRRKLPASLGVLPREACEVLGRRRLDARTQLTLVRLDRRVLVLGLGPDGARTLAELTDPAEIDRLAGLCRLNDVAQSAGRGFGSMLQKQLTPAATPQPAAASGSITSDSVTSGSITSELADLNRDNFEPAAPRPHTAASYTPALSTPFTAATAPSPPASRLDVSTP